MIHRSGSSTDGMPSNGVAIRRTGPCGERQEYSGQGGVRMRLHRCHEGAIGDDDPLRPHGEGEGDVQGVVSAVIDGEPNFQRDVVQTEFRGWRRFHLRAQ